MNNRMLSIDFLRGFAIFAMIQGHIWEFYIAAPTGYGRIIHQYIIGPIGGYAAPLFIILSGFSSFLAYQHYKKRGAGEKLLAVRGIMLFTLATLIFICSNWILNPNDISIVNWGPIQLIGLCLLLQPLFSRLNWLYQLITATLILVIPIKTFPAHLSFLTDGFVPIIPWGALFFSGYILSEYYFFLHHRYSNNSHVIFTSSSILLVPPIYLLAIYVGQPFEWTHRSNPTTASFLGYIGIFILLVGILGYFLDRSNYNHWLTNSVSNFGRHALTIYYLQLFVVVIGAKTVALFTGYFLQFDWLWYIPLTMAVLICFHFLINVVWKTYDHIFSLEWFFTNFITKLNNTHLRARVH